MSRRQVRVTSAQHSRGVNNISTKTTYLHIHVPRQTRSAYGVPSAVIPDGLSCKSIVNMNKHGIECKDKAEDLTPATELYQRTVTSPRASRLMLGSGKLRRTDTTENVELHLDNEEYRNLVKGTNDDIPMYEMNRINNPCESSSPRAKDISTPIPLPKTYATRSGPLFLFSDNKVVADHKKESVVEGQQTNKSHHNNGIEVKGHRLSTRQSYPLWGKRLQKKTTVSTDARSNSVYTKRGQRSYIGLGNRAGIQNPYAWNYSVVPFNLVNLKKTDTCKQIKTLNNFSSAVLDYRTATPTISEKYLATIKHTGQKPRNERSEEKSREFQKLSRWTNEWITAQEFQIVEEYASIVNNDDRLTSYKTGGKPINRGQIQIKLPAHQPSDVK